MTTETCGTCNGTVITEDGGPWESVYVVFCGGCAAAYEAEEAFARSEAFDELLSLEAKVNDCRIRAEVGYTQMVRNEGKHAWKLAKQDLYAAIDRLSLDELRAYAEYRKAARDGRVA